MFIKNLLKKTLFNLMSRRRGFSDLKVLSGPAKGSKLRLDIRKEDILARELR